MNVKNPKRGEFVKNLTSEKLNLNNFYLYSQSSEDDIREYKQFAKKLHTETSSFFQTALTIRQVIHIEEDWLNDSKLSLRMFLLAEFPELKLKEREQIVLRDEYLHECSCKWDKNLKLISNDIHNKLVEGWENSINDFCKNHIEYFLRVSERNEQIEKLEKLLEIKSKFISNGVKLIESPDEHHNKKIKIQANYDKYFNLELKLSYEDVEKILHLFKNEIEFKIHPKYKL
jgi:hypothetical protein